MHFIKSTEENIFSFFFKVIQIQWYSHLRFKKIILALSLELLLEHLREGGRGCG